MIKKISLLLLVAILSLTSCKSSKYPDLENGLYAEIQTEKGDILVKLEPKKAPVTVASFVSLIEGNNPFVKDEYKGKPFYDGLTFHRIVSKATGAQRDFVIQGGDPLGTGQGGPGYQFKNEISDLKHIKGALSMAREPKPGTNGSQFFIVLDKTPHLDGQYSVFGNTIKGFDVVQKIRKGDKMTKVTVIRQGNDAKKFDAIKIFSEYMKGKVTAQKAVQANKEKLVADLKAKKAQAKEDESGLKIYTIKEGTGRMPKAGETVQVHYTGYLTNGTKFDSSYDRKKPLLFPIGKGNVIAGWDKGIMKLKEGGKAILFIPPHLGYGSRGAGGVIPPNADLIFEVELVKIGK
jgi:peptidylprolyl isomerase